MKWTMEVPLDAPAPKRGDLLYSFINDSNRLQRTWLVLKSTRMRNEDAKVYAASRAMVGDRA